jgi:hypothetical protein
LNATEVLNVCEIVARRFNDFWTLTPLDFQASLFTLMMLLLSAKHIKQHQGQLRQLLSRFRKYGLKGRLSKLPPAAEEVNYLGYNINKRMGLGPGL